jgi:DNA polymerase-3 subunit epsilon
LTLNFTAIDFETANEQRGSVCAVGIAQVRGGAIVESTGWLIQPPTGNRFTNTRIHGIAADDVMNGSTWADSLAAIEAYVGNGVLVAYNSPFDKGVYSAASRLAGLEPEDRVWRCARVLAKTHLILDSYRLVDVTKHLGLPHFDHHNAEADARACASVALKIARTHDAETVDTLWPVSAIAQGARSYYRRLPLPVASTAADPEHPLYGASVTFTGELEGFTRDEARSACAALGATITAGPTKKTDVVVVGGFDPATLRPEATVSSKLQKAMDLRASGLHLELISEADFTALLAYESGR